jgi:5-methylcytosine-specific restriction endonuclease McrA
MSTHSKPLVDILVEKSTYQSNKLRKRLLADGLKEHKCEVCFNTTWMDKPIPLELDHINSINDDHRLHNLRLLCPNCHAQTDCYRGRNWGKASKRHHWAPA